MMCVGDPDQNIYAWRGASLRNILRFADEFTGDSRPLYVNFRSGSRILEVANRVISEVPEERRGEGQAAPAASVARRGPRARVRRARRARTRRARSRGSSRRSAPPAGRTARSRCCAVRSGCSGRSPRSCGKRASRSRSSTSAGCCSCRKSSTWSRGCACSRTPAATSRWRACYKGPQWRIGYRDLVALARWSAAAQPPVEGGSQGGRASRRRRVRARGGARQPRRPRDGRPLRRSAYAPARVQRAVRVAARRRGRRTARRARHRR